MIDQGIERNRRQADGRVAATVVDVSEISHMNIHNR